MKAPLLPFRKFNTEVPNVCESEIVAYQKHFDLLWDWNKKAFLVSMRGLLDPFAAHYVDSIHIADFVFENRLDLSVHDLGSGGGFPGVIYAIRHPDSPVFCYERNLKKQMFLERVRVALPLTNLNLMERIPEKLPVGIFTARAFLPPERLFSFFGRRMIDRSRFVLCLGGQDQRSFDYRNFTQISERRYRLPEDHGERRVILFESVPRGTNE